MIQKRTRDLIRSVINDPEDGSVQFTNEEIADTYEALGENLPLTIAVLLYSKALEVAWPAAPSAPSISSSPDVSFGFWDRKVTHDLNLFTQQLSLYREQATQARALIDIYKQQAQVFVELAKAGDLL